MRHIFSAKNERPAFNKNVCYIATITTTTQPGPTNLSSQNIPSAELVGGINKMQRSNTKYILGTKKTDKVCSPFLSLPTFLATVVFWISMGCCAMLENGTSTEYLMLWSSWITMFETILKEGRRLPPGIRALRA